MRKFFLSLAAFGVVAALGAPAPAAEFKASGTIKAKHIITSEAAGPAGTTQGATEFGAPNTGQFYPTKELKTRRLTTMRANPLLQFLATEHSGFVWAGEIDVDFGDRSYYTGSGDGGGLAADTVNIETKDLYLHFDIPETPLSFRAGITGVVDSYDLVILGTDTAGFRILADMGDTRLNVDWLRFWDDSELSIVDDVDFYMLTISQKLMGKYTLGGSFYYLKDGSGEPAGTGQLNNGFGVRNPAPQATTTVTGATPAPPATSVTASTALPGVSPSVLGLGKGLNWLTFNGATGRSPIIPRGTKYALDAYYLGLFGTAPVGPVTLKGWGLYNFGTVEDKSTGGGDVDIKAFAVDLTASAKIQDISVSLDGIYVSGNDKQVGDGDFGLITANQYQLAGAFFYKHGMMILLPDGDDLNNSTALVYDPANIYESTYLGIMGVFANATVPMVKNLTGRLGVGYLTSAEKRIVNQNKSIGTEVNATVTYTLAAGTTVYLNGAYAWTGDFYDVSTAERDAYNASITAGDRFGGNVAANEKDNIYYTSLVFRVAM